jgi:hypothetical protein
MKTATYTGMDGAPIVVEYDEMAPCVYCGEPVISASTSGTNVCPACDCGKCRYCLVDLITVSSPWSRARRALLAHIQFHKALAGAE